MAKNLDRVFECRKEDLRKSKLGATIDEEPQILWVKMMDRINVTDKILAVRHRFNTSLENALEGKINHRVMDINQQMNNSAFFSPTHKFLTDQGIKNFWSALDVKIQ